MYVARVLYPVEVLGPGKRVGIWFCGCPHRCKGCSNPELWEFQDRYKTTPQRILGLVLQIAKKHPIDGFTITGGDPMYQSAALKELILLLRSISTDILVYTGYNRSELSDEQLSGITVLIDGEYIESRNTNCRLRGSDNQSIYILNDGFRERYNDYLSSTENQVQNFMTSDGMVSVGIHRPGFITDLNKAIMQKGVKNNEFLEAERSC